MKHIVFLVGSYYPDYSAVGTCCFNIVEEMAKENKVTVICRMSGVDQPPTEQYQGHSIVRVSHRWWDMRLTLVERVRNASGMSKWLYRMLLDGVRARDCLSIVLSRISVDEDLIHAYLVALNSLEEPPDVVVPFCLPVEAVCAGIDYKKRAGKVKLIPYLFDRIVGNKGRHRLPTLEMLKSRQCLTLEREMVDSSTAVMVVNSQENHFKMHFAEDLDSIYFVEHPLVKQVYVRNPQYVASDSLEECTLVYTGSFVKGYVIPDYMLDVLFIARERLDVTLHLYGEGSGYSAVQQCQSRMADTIVYHGRVDKNTAMDAIARANILISVAENSGVQVSSKIFEYMSVGKPIVHFYTAEQDVNTKILKDYPLCLCLKQSNALLQENTNKLVRFIEIHRNSTLAFHEVERLYPCATPRFIAGQMMKIIKGHHV